MDIDCTSCSSCQLRLLLCLFVSLFLQSAVIVVMVYTDIWIPSLICQFRPKFNIVWLCNDSLVWLQYHLKIFNNNNNNVISITNCTIEKFIDRFAELSFTQGIASSVHENTMLSWFHVLLDLCYYFSWVIYVLYDHELHHWEYSWNMLYWVNTSTHNKLTKTFTPYQY